VESGKAVIQTGVLKDQPDGLAYLVLLPYHVKAVQRSPPGGRSGQGTENVDGGCLASPVGTQKTENFARNDVKTDVVHGHQFAEFLNQVFYFDNIIGHFYSSIARRQLFQQSSFGWDHFFRARPPQRKITVRVNTANLC
jgi:hypothetical protein